MSRLLNSTAIASILDALNIRRQAALLALPYAADELKKASRLAHSPHYSRQLAAPLKAELDCNELIETAIAEAIALQTTALASVSTSVVAGGCSGMPALRSLPDQRSAPVPPVPKEEIGSVLEGRRLQGLSLDGLRFTASFNRADLSGCSLRRCYVAHSTFNLTQLTHSNLSDAQFHSCTFIGADAASVLAKNCRFSHCQFRQCDLRHWDVRGATFFRCTFTLSDLCAWSVDGQTTVIEPTDWSRCRRLGWQAVCRYRDEDCRVVGKGTEQALSLPPAEPSSRSRRSSSKRKGLHGPRTPQNE